MDPLKTPPFPKYIQFETNTVCNAHCRMCPRDKMQRAGRATWATIDKIIQEAVPQAEVCYPFLMQEPLLETRLVPILSKIRACNPECKTVIFTNMNTLTPTQTQMIIDGDLLDELYISFYGPTEKLYAKWQPPLNWKQTISNIQSFHCYRQQKQKELPRIHAMYLGIPELWRKRKHLLQLIGKYLDTFELVPYDTFHGDIPNYGGDQTEYFGHPPAPRTPCQRLWNVLIIHFNGDVVPCCIDYQGEHVLGNIYEHTLHEIWEGIQFQKFLNLHLKGEWNTIPMCQSCVVHEYQFSQEWINYWLTKSLFCTVT